MDAFLEAIKYRLKEMELNGVPQPDEYPFGGRGERIQRQHDAKDLVQMRDLGLPSRAHSLDPYHPDRAHKPLYPKYLDPELNQMEYPSLLQPGPNKNLNNLLGY